MNLYIIAKKTDAEHYADLLQNIVAINKICYLDEDYKLRIKKSDFILVVYDKSLLDDKILLEKLKIACSCLEDKDNMIVIKKDEIPNNFPLNDYVSLSLDEATNEDELVKTIKMIISIQYLKKSNFTSEENIERKRKLNPFTGTLITYLLIIIGTIFITETGFIDKTVDVLYSLIVLTIIFLMIVFMYLLNRENEDKNDSQLKKYTKKINRILKNNSNNTLRLMGENLIQIKEYYIWGQKQVKMSFYLAAGLCVAGFVLLSVSIYLAYNNQKSLTLLPTIGGVTTELIAGTVLIVYRNSLKQLNSYHQTLHENERLLLSVDLLGKFKSQCSQDEMLKEIIKNELQMNILSIQNDSSKKEITKQDNKQNNSQTKNLLENKKDF